MSKRLPLHWENHSPLHYNISIRNEYVGFTCMFCLFAFLAFFMTIFLSILAHNAYYHDSEVMQRRFIPYSLLGAISLLLFLIFVAGSCGYTCKLLGHSRSKPTSASPVPRPRKADNSTGKSKTMSDEFLPITAEKSFHIATKPRNPSPSQHACQTDV